MLGPLSIRNKTMTKELEILKWFLSTHVSSAQTTISIAFKRCDFWYTTRTPAVQRLETSYNDKQAHHTIVVIAHKLQIFIKSNCLNNSFTHVLYNKLKGQDGFVIKAGENLPLDHILEHRRYKPLQGIPAHG